MVKVLNPGFYTTVQDFGRVGFQEYGVPSSGVMDQKAALIANTLLGNYEKEAVLEMTMTGAKLQFEINTFIAISGADMSPKLNEKPIELNKKVAVRPNDILSFGSFNLGFRCYLAVMGGFKTESVLGSKSMFHNVTKQVSLSKNDTLLCENINEANGRQNASIRIDTSYINLNIIEVFKGPEFELLNKKQQNELLSKAYTISKNNNRMAYQIEETLQNNLKPIITSAVFPGTVQLTPSGKLIVLMRDCQTTGGYPRVLQLKESAINILAQKFTGNPIKFQLNSKY